jgi:hypothetical protein
MVGAVLKMTGGSEGLLHSLYKLLKNSLASASGK